MEPAANSPITDAAKALKASREKFLTDYNADSVGRVDRINGQIEQESAKFHKWRTFQIRAGGTGAGLILICIPVVGHFLVGTLALGLLAGIASVLGIAGLVVLIATSLTLGVTANAKKRREALEQARDNEQKVVSIEMVKRVLEAHESSQLNVEEILGEEVYEDLKTYLRHGSELSVALSKERAKRRHDEHEQTDFPVISIPLVFTAGQLKDAFQVTANISRIELLYRTVLTIPGVRTAVEGERAGHNRPTEVDPTVRLSYLPQELGITRDSLPPLHI